MISGFCQKKRGYFFIMDAMIALFIVIIGVYLISSSYTNAPQTVQVGLLSDDLLNFLSNTKIRNLNNQYAGIGGELWNNGLIKDEDNSLLQQIGEFYSMKNPEIAENFILNVSQGVIPPQFNYEVWINGEAVFPKTQTAVHLKSKEMSPIMLASRKITFGVLNATTGEMWGPYKAEVYVWEK